MKSIMELFFKKQKHSLLGIDLTTHDIKIVELSRLADNRYRIEGYAYKELPGGLVGDDIVLDTTQVGQIIKDLVESNKFLTKDVAICVPKNTVITQNIVVTGDNEREIESEIENSGKKYIHSDIGEVEFDFKILSDNSDTSKNVLLVACKKKNITTRDDSIVIAGLEPKIVDNESYVYERIFPTIVNQVQYELAAQDKNINVILMVELFEKKIKTVLLNNGSTVYNEEQSIEIDRRSLKTISLEDESNIHDISAYQKGVCAAINKVINLVSASSGDSNQISCITFMGQEKYIEETREYVENKLKINCRVANPTGGMEISDKINILDLAEKASLLVVACGLAMRENKYD